MSIEATADALAADTAAPTEVTEQPTMEDELSALYDRMTTEEEPEQDEPAEQPEIEEAAEEAASEEPDEAEEAKPVDVPPGLPADLRKHWATLSDEARSAIVADRDGLHRKLSDMGRQVQGIAPIRDVLIEATQKMPALANMRPQDAAREIFQLAEISQKFSEKPVETMLGLIQKHGLQQAMAQALSGQKPGQETQYVNALQNKITQLERQVQRFSDPDYLSQQVTQITSQQSTLNEVEQFAQTADHWADVEEHIPLYIPAVRAKLGQGAAPGAVLKAAYERAIQDFVPDAKAPTPPADEAQADPDPDRTAKALKAKSVNLSGKSTGKQRVLTEEEHLAMIYDKAAKR